MSDRDIYEEGYRDGAERWRERCERLQIQLDGLRKHYDYLLNLIADNAAMQLPPRIIVMERDGQQATTKGEQR